MEHASRITVQKYGGSSVATHQKIKQIATLISQRALAGERLCIVVSAMGKTTDQLLALALELSNNPSRRELDMLLSCGERASMALLAIALEDMGCRAVSLTGSQSGIITSDVHSGAKILEVRPNRVLAELEKGKVVIVAGFQGVSINREITTLGRGGSDTTAIALAAALNADSCEIYSDVNGVFSTDPNIVKDAQQLPHISLDEMEELSLYGAKVMHFGALQFAREHGIAIRAMKTGDEAKGTLISPDAVDRRLSRALLTFKEGVLHFVSNDEDSFERFYETLADRRVGHVQVVGANGQQSGGWHVLVHPEDAHGIASWANCFEGVVHQEDCSTISIVGLGLCDTPRVTSRALSILLRAGFRILGVNSAPNRFTCILPTGDGAKAAALLHRELDLVEIGTQ